jgi:glucosamine--fructose-6-phosphate aminotransferase (isomerizing)
MCGIIAGISEDICEILIEGLKQLQNRGYDSAGITLLNNKTNEFLTRKKASTATVSALDYLENSSSGIHNLGIAHTRWATHGPKTDINSHPHESYDGQFVLVHNGIIENYKEIRGILERNNIQNISETDSECIVNLLALYYSQQESSEKSVVGAIQKTINMMTGTWGLVIMARDKPDTLFSTRQGSPLLVGHSDNSVIITSEQSGFAGRIQNYFILKNRDICSTMRREDGTIKIETTTTEKYESKTVTGDATELSPAPFSHWMLKEIHEQPESIRRVIKQGSRLLDNDKVHLGGLNDNIEFLRNVDHLVLLGCGTSLNAAKFAISYFKTLCSFVSVSWKDGADFSVDDVSHHGTTALILLSQSGETKDLHRCIEIANNHNLFTIGIVNVIDSLIAREVECGCYLHAGREVAVASTKSFTSQCILLTMVAVWFSQVQEPKVRKNLQRKHIICDIRKLASDVETIIETSKKQIPNLTRYFMDYPSCFVLGKGRSEAVAHEASLKIKEISYIHAEGYSTSSLKHGPFALLYEGFPVIMIMPKDEHHAKAQNAYEEVASRHAKIISIGDYAIEGKSETHITLPENKTFASLLGIIPIQLLSYELAKDKGYNPDMPRNLAKVVTVE